MPESNNSIDAINTINPNNAITQMDKLMHSPISEPSLWFELILIALVIAASFYFIFHLKHKINQKQFKDLSRYEQISKMLAPFLGLLVFLTIDLIIFGAFTRLSASGLGCPDWPGCYTTSNPFFANTQIGLEQAANPNGPVTFSKAWIEMIHRYFASSLGVLVIFLNYLMFKRYKTQKNFFAKKSLQHSLFILVLICLQGAFGAWTVTYKLQPIIVSTHLLLALFFLANLAWLYLREKNNLNFNLNPSLNANSNFNADFKIQNNKNNEINKKNEALNASPIVHEAQNHLLKVFKIFFVFLVLQIFLGAWVSTHYAVFGCTEFPTCLPSNLTQGQSALTYANWPQALHFWRETNNAGLAPLDMATLTAIHLLHRAGAIFLLLAYIYLFIRTSRLKTVCLNAGVFNILPEKTKFYLNICGVILLLQMLTGVANVILGYPLLAALLHTLGATLLLLFALYAYYPLHDVYHFHRRR